MVLIDSLLVMKATIRAAFNVAAAWLWYLLFYSLQMTTLRVRKSHFVTFFYLFWQLSRFVALRNVQNIMVMESPPLDPDLPCQKASIHRKNCVPSSAVSMFG